MVAGMGIEGVDTVEGLRQDAYDYLYENANTNYHYSLQDAIVGALLEQSNFENISAFPYPSGKESFKSTVSPGITPISPSSNPGINRV